MLRDLQRALQAEEAGGPEPLVIELTTFGGDADVARRMTSEIRLFRERTGRSTLFLGATTVYSSGVSIMGGFPPRDRWLTRDTTLLVHGRSLAKTLELSGPLSVERVRVQAVLAEIEMGLRLELEDFERLVHGTGVSLAEVLERAPSNWYVPAAEAVSCGLVAGLV